MPVTNRLLKVCNCLTLSLHIILKIYLPRSCISRVNHIICFTYSAISCDQLLNKWQQMFHNQSISRCYKSWDNNQTQRNKHQMFFFSLLYLNFVISLVNMKRILVIMFNAYNYFKFAQFTWWIKFKIVLWILWKRSKASTKHTEHGDNIRLMFVGWISEYLSPMVPHCYLYLDDIYSVIWITLPRTVNHF